MRIARTDLIAAIDDVYARHDPASWPDPWGGGDPEESAYSRVTRPERYRIVHLRVAAWVEVLTDLGICTAERYELRDSVDWPSGVVMSSPLPGTIPLRTREHALGGVWETPAVELEAGDGIHRFQAWPDCGCDACDTGSDTLLEGLDDDVLSVTGRRYATMRTGDSIRAFATADAWEANGPSDVDVDGIMEMCCGLVRGQEVTVPVGAVVTIGEPWFTLTGDADPE